MQGLDESHESTLKLVGVRERTLKNVSLELPLGKLILVSGVSGAGKTSLVVETIFAESQRRYLETFSPSIRQRLSGVKTPKLDEASGLVNCLLITGDRGRYPKRKPVFEILDADEALRMLMMRGSDVFCPVCGGKLVTSTAEQVVHELLESYEGKRAVIGVPADVSSSMDAEARLIELGAGKVLQIVDRVRLSSNDRGRVMESIELAMMDAEGRCLVLVENEGGEVEYQGRSFEKKAYSSLPYCWKNDRWVVMPEWNWDAPGDTTDESAFRYAGLTFRELLGLTASALYEKLVGIEQEQDRDVVVKNARAKLIRVNRVLVELGLSHLKVGQRFGETSGGEKTRLLLANVVLLEPVESMLMIDELSPGLSDESLSDAIAALKALVGRGNTVVVVDHHPALVASADWIVEMGPGAGSLGGEVVYSGDAKDWERRGETLILEAVEAPKKRTWAKLDDGVVGNFQLKGVKLQVGGINVVTGLRGKTQFLKEVLQPFGAGQETDAPKAKKGKSSKTGMFDEVVLVDQERVSGSKRSTPSSMMKLMPEIRELFAETLEAQLRNWNSRYFSLHVDGGGRCPRCLGVGEVEVDLKHLALVSVVCPECHGTRYLPEVLNARYRGLSIAEVLELSVDDAFVFFRSQMGLQKKLQVMRELGLGYLRLGQPTRTLSSGEVQRLKIATNLVSISAKKKLFLLDEPTSGLHASEIEKLWTTLRELTAGGHTVVIAEHEKGVIEAADHRIAVEADSVGTFLVVG